MTNLSKNLYPLGRALLGTLFLVSGIDKTLGFADVAGWMSSAGLPFATVLLAATILIEIVGGLLLILGWQAQWAALAIALFLIPVTLVFHAFWSADAANFQGQLTNFLKNVSILGGMLLVFDRERAAESVAARNAPVPAVY